MRLKDIICFFLANNSRKSGSLRKVVHGDEQSHTRPSIEAHSARQPASTRRAPLLFASFACYSAFALLFLPVWLVVWPSTIIIINSSSNSLSSDSLLQRSARPPKALHRIQRTALRIFCVQSCEAKFFSAPRRANFAPRASSPTFAIAFFTIQRASPHGATLRAAPGFPTYTSFLCEGALVAVDAVV